MVFTVWQPAPESFEARAMPAKDGLRLNHLGHAEQARPEPGHPPAAELCLILIQNAYTGPGPKIRLQRVTYEVRSKTARYREVSQI